MIVSVVATAQTAAAAQATVRAVRQVAPEFQCAVFDVDGAYQPTGFEKVAAPDDIPVGKLRLTHHPHQLAAALNFRWALHLVQATNQPVLSVAAGLLPRAPAAGTDYQYFGQLTELLNDSDATCAVASAPQFDVASANAPASYTTSLFRLGTDALPYASVLEQLTENWRAAPRIIDLLLPYLPQPQIINNLNLDDIFDRYYPAASAPAPAAAPSELVSDREDVELVQKIARAAIERGESLDRAVANLTSWLLELLPSGDRAPVARYLAGIYAERADLRGTFRFVPGASASEFALWAAAEGGNDAAFDYDADLLKQAAAVTLAAQPKLEKPGAVRPEGVNLIGYLSGELGMGTSARLLDQALQAAHIPTSTYPVTASLANRAGANYRDTEQVRYDISLIHVNSPHLPEVCGVLADVVDDSYRIAMWSWETEDFPPSQFGGFPYADEIWTSTDFMTAAIAPHSPVPVFTVPPPLPQPYAGTRPPIPAGLGIPDDGRPWFLFVFDYLSTPERKNPWGLVSAYCQAFPVAEPNGPMLVIKTINAKKHPTESSYLKQLTRDRPDIIIIDRYLSETDLMGLMANCTAYVSLHRAEGYGLTIAEAMAWGRPVIVSDYSGNLQFNTPENSYLVPCEIVPIPHDAPPYTPGTPWGDPDLTVAAELMRTVVANPQAAAAVGAQAERDIRELHNPQVAGEHLAAVLAAARLRAAPILAERRAAAKKARLLSMRDAGLRQIRGKVAAALQRL